MKTIHKYAFNVTDIFPIAMPRGAQILKVETQLGQPCIWAMVDTEMPMDSRVFLCFGTGHPMDPAGDSIGPHVATFQQGPFVWHLFECRKTTR